MIEYLEWFDRCPISEDGPEKVIRQNSLVKIQWDNDKDDEYTKRIIVRIGVLLGHLRAVVTTWETHGTQGLDYNYATATREEPERAITQLRNLARGMVQTLLVRGNTQWEIAESLDVKPTNY